PPALVVAPPIDLQQLSKGQDLADVLTEHQENLRAQTQEFVGDLLRGGERDGKEPAERKAGAAPSLAQTATGVTAEQQLRGRRGEEEIRRRLLLPGGWEGFVFLEDHRQPPRGYDFLASFGNEAAKLEVKTFTSGGQ